MNTNVRFYLSHNCRKDRNIHFKLEKTLLGSREEVWSSDVTSVTSQWMTSHLLVALLLVTWLQSFVSETGNQFLPYPIICIYSREPVVIALVQYFIFIEWVLLHSQTLCYVIILENNPRGTIDYGKYVPSEINVHEGHMFRNQSYWVGYSNYST
jgi:hypothetical protein